MVSHQFIKQFHSTNTWLWIKRLFIVSCITILLIVAFWHRPIAYANKTIIVATPVLNVRDHPGLQSHIITTIHQGEAYTLLKEENKWDKIQVNNHEVGWVASWLVKQQQYINFRAEATVKSAGLHIRQQPGIGHKIIGYLKAGDHVTVIGQSEGWSNILLDNGNGWVSSKYITTKERPTISLLYNHSRLRAKPSLNAKVLSVGMKGQQYQVIGTSGDWYKINLKNGKDAYVADWIVKKVQSTAAASPINTNHFAHKQSPTFSTQLTGKVIVIDPGHGGSDDGTTSLNGIHEKQLTLATAKQVKDKLESYGATVILTRSADQYISLQQRVNIAEQHHADAYISLHYNSSPMPSINGITSFYYNRAKDRTLASDINKDVIKATGLEDRGVRFGDLHVLRENSQPATLIELGFLSNPKEENIVEQISYEKQVAEGIYKGLLDYFHNNN